MKTIRDLIYLDLGKAASLLSQIEGGLVKQFVEKDETSETKSGEAKLGIKLIEGDFGKTTSDSSAVEWTKEIHHELIDSIEEWLFTQGFALDINEITIEDGTKITGEMFRELLENVSYVRVEGMALIDDFSRLQDLTKNFHNLVEFINKCNQFALKENNDYQGLKKQIFELKKELKRLPTGSEKDLKDRQIQEFETQLEQAEREVTKVDEPEDWLLQGISMWIEQFNPDQIHFRVRPFEHNQIEVAANLKRDCFVDTNIDHLLFTYGVEPNRKLTMFGLITSMPEKEKIEDIEEIISEEDKDQEQTQDEFQSAFREVFKAIAGFEKFSGFDLFPNIKVYPIAVYRKIHSFYSEDEVENAEENQAL